MHMHMEGIRGWVCRTSFSSWRLAYTTNDTSSLHLRRWDVLYIGSASSMAWVSTDPCLLCAYSVLTVAVSAGLPDAEIHHDMAVAECWCWGSNTRMRIKLAGWEYGDHSYSPMVSTRVRDYINVISGFL